MVFYVSGGIVFRPGSGMTQQRITQPGCFFRSSRRPLIVYRQIRVSGYHLSDDLFQTGSAGLHQILITKNMIGRQVLKLTEIPIENKLLPGREIRYFLKGGMKVRRQAVRFGELPP